MKKLTISQMAKANNISEQTLRLYDKIGLLKPECVNEQTGYRYYSITQSACLDMIQYMKALGMSLGQIKEQLDLNNISLIEKLLLCQNTSIDRQIENLTITKCAVQRALESIRRYKAAPDDGAIVLEYLPDRKIYMYDSGFDFYSRGIEAYEMMVRELKKKIILKKLPMAYFCNIGSILRQERLARRDFFSTEIFMFIDDHIKSEEGIGYIASGTYLCIYCDSFHKELEYADRLLDAIEERKYTITGDYICEVLAELPVFSKNERNMFIKLQIPVRVK